MRIEALTSFAVDSWGETENGSGYVLIVNLVGTYTTKFHLV